MPKKKSASVDKVWLAEPQEYKETQWYRWISRIARKLIYDNHFFERLFPLIKQQKPGTDLYVHIASIQIVLLIYLFIFYGSMAGDHEDIATQFSANSFSQGLVFTLITFIIAMIIDRILYSKHVLLSGRVRASARQENLPSQAKPVPDSRRTHSEIMEETLQSSIDQPYGPRTLYGGKELLDDILSD